MTTPAFTSPVDFTFKEMLTSDILNLLLVNNMLVVAKPPSFQTYIAGAQSIANNNHVAIAFDNINWDTDGAINLATGVFTAPFAGLWRFDGIAPFAPNATGVRGITFYKNGGAFQEVANQPASSALEQVLSGGCTMNLALNDTVTMNCYQNSGGSLNVGTGSAPDLCTMTGYMISQTP